MSRFVPSLYVAPRPSAACTQVTSAPIMNRSPTAPAAPADPPPACPVPPRPPVDWPPPPAAAPAMPPAPAVPTLPPPRPAAAPTPPKLVPALPPNPWPAPLLPAIALAPPLLAPERPELPAPAGFVPVLEQAQQTMKITAARLRPEAARVIGSSCTSDKGRENAFPFREFPPRAAHEPAARRPPRPFGPGPGERRADPTREPRWGLTRAGSTAERWALTARTATPLRAVARRMRMWRFCESPCSSQCCRANCGGARKAQTQFKRPNTARTIVACGSSER